MAYVLLGFLLGYFIIAFVVARVSMRMARGYYRDSNREVPEEDRRLAFSFGLYWPAWIPALIFVYVVTLFEAANIRDFILGYRPPKASPEHDQWLDLRYQCPDCGHEWRDQWSSAVDAECPECGTKDISPVSWDESDEEPPARKG